MGCQGSALCGQTELIVDPRLQEATPSELLDRYSLGHVLGTGTTGVVCVATDRNSNEDYAVKVMDLAEMPEKMVRREARMLQRLKHPRIATCHGVYFDALSVCLVTDIYRGGDLLGGMQRHHQEKGSVSVHVVQRISQMMLEASEWLHRHGIVHRDLKGDNFLLTCEGIEDPECQVILSDFGTAKSLSPGQRLAQKVGTTLYWAPELFSQDYGLAVDLWALGVIVFGMMWGRFPFMNEEETRTKPFRCPPDYSDHGENFLQGILAKSESERFTSAKAMEHAFLAGP